MEPHLGTNWIPSLVLLPLVLIVAGGVYWLIAKMRIEKWQRALLAVVAIFAVLGFAVSIGVVYYHVNWQFADTFNVYAYSALAPGGDPFHDIENELEPVLMLRDVWTGDRAGEIARNPNPDFETIVYLFVPGKYITANLKDEQLIIPELPAESLPAEIETSLWWALTKNIHEEVFPVESG